MHSFKSAFLAISAVWCLLLSCDSPEYLSEGDLLQYVSENEALSKSVSSGNIEIRVTYRPTDLLVAQEIRINPNVTQKQIQEARNRYGSHFYFIISFSRSGEEVLNASKADVAGFSQLLQTMSFRMSEVVNLTTAANDTIPVSDYIYNRTFGMSSSTDLLFVFDKAKAKSQEWIQINLDEFGLGIGKQSVRFNVSDLEKAPRIFKTQV